MKKIGTAAGLAATAIVIAVLSGAALANGTHRAAKPDSASPAAKVYICHATGSASNPYVLIHVSSHALSAHTGHQSGHDIVLGSSPGACPQPAPATPSVKAAEQAQFTPTVQPQEQSNNAPASKANEPQDNNAAEASDQSESASEQGEASDQNQSASDEDKSASEDQARSHDDNGRGDDSSGDGEQHASDQQSSDQHSSDQSGD